MSVPSPGLRIDWIAPPFAGHLLPMLAIARSLELRGVASMRVLSTPLYADAVHDAGLRFVPILDAQEDAILRFANGDQRFGSNPVALTRQFRAAVGFLGRLQSDVRALWSTKAPDLVIADSVLPSVGPVAAEHGVPWWTSLASLPTLETPDGPPAYLGGLRPGRGYLGRARDAAGRRAVRLFKRAAFMAARAPLRAQGLSRVYRDDGSEACYSDDTILGLGYPELEFASRWPASLHVVGAPLATPHRADELASLDATRPHLLVTLGTHLPWAKRTALPEARELAARLSQWTIHYSHGEAGGSLDRTTNNFRELSWVPYGPGLAAYRAVLHHGGAGVTYATLGAGVPALVRPRDFDQHDFAARLEHHGLGIQVRPGVRSVLRALPALEALRPACERAQAALLARDPVDTVERLLRARFGQPTLGR